MSQELAEKAVKIVEKRLVAIGLNPHNFSSQIALCDLLQWAEEEPESDVAQWILSAPKDQLWKRSQPGDALTEGDNEIHECFREAWQNFLEGNLPVM